MFQRSCSIFVRPRIHPNKAVIKPPRNPNFNRYQCFVSEASKRPEVLAIKSFHERSMMIGHLWRNMKEADKKPFEEMAKKSRAKSASQKRTGIKKPDGWKMFVKKNYKHVKHYPLNERLQVLSAKWKSLNKKK